MLEGFTLRQAGGEYRKGVREQKEEEAHARSEGCCVVKPPYCQFVALLSILLWFNGLLIWTFPLFHVSQRSHWQTRRVVLIWRWFTIHVNDPTFLDVCLWAASFHQDLACVKLLSCLRVDYRWLFPLGLLLQCSSPTWSPQGSEGLWKTWTNTYFVVFKCLFSKLFTI